VCAYRAASASKPWPLASNQSRLEIGVSNDRQFIHFVVLCGVRSAERVAKSNCPKAALLVEISGWR